MSTFTMPSLGADMEAGKLVEWLVKPGDAVKRGDIVAVVETQKGAIEIEIFEDGKVGKLMADLGQTLPVGAPLAEIVGAGEEVPAQAAEPVSETVSEPTSAPVVTPELATAPAPPPTTIAPAAGPGSSPAARARAAELGIDLSSVSGSGPGGAIVLADVEGLAKSAPAPTPSAPAAGSDARTNFIAEMRKAIAAAMARSKREIPHYYVTHTVDLTAASSWLSAANAERPLEERLLMGALLAKAVALAAREVHQVNGHYGEGGFTPSGEVNLGLAVALRGGGLIAPAIMNADALDLAGLMAAMRDVTTRTRAGRLRSSEMSMGTITFSGLGENGVETMAGIIVPPQVALVTAGAPQPMALVRDGAVVAATAVTFTLAADHRVSDGRLGAKFLLAMDRFLQTPEAL
ncbi:dihydrolipoamide acetyltransferase family protein [Breoghania sp.]|uniref:dihydrolipoamide acetyltransferase family protein n=1 Tax=Breoghania sp. TaxID=2065378 RepID=UPI002AA9110A|nr:dihydrolipoamide acetyltransferase family protein [Breoghania sp.]